MPTDSGQIERLVRLIVEAVHPLRIVLFGSAARGQTTPDSDIDLLVVMPEGTHRRRTSQLLYRTIRGIRTPFDLIVATPGDLEKHRDNVGLIYRNALREGRTMYGA
jgi:predicted nucleotidyltransferase